MISYIFPSSNHIEFLPGAFDKPDPEDHCPERPVKTHGKGHTDNPHIHPDGKNNREQHSPDNG